MLALIIVNMPLSAFFPLQMVPDPDPPIKKQHWHRTPGAASGREKCRHLGKGLRRCKEVLWQILRDSGFFFFNLLHGKHFKMGSFSFSNSVEKKQSSGVHSSKDFEDLLCARHYTRLLEYYQWIKTDNDSFPHGAYFEARRRYLKSFWQFLSIILTNELVTEVCPFSTQSFHALPLDGQLWESYFCLSWSSPYRLPVQSHSGFF